MKYKTLSEFLRKATDEEKSEVFMEVVKRANKDQRETVGLCKVSNQRLT